MPRLPFKIERRPRDFDTRLADVKREKELFDKEAEIRDVKKSMRRFQKPTTTKLVMAFIFVNLTVVEIFSMVAMWHFENLDALYSLITAVISESLAFAVYCAKSFGENREAELIKLERDKMAMVNVVPEEDDGSLDGMGNGDLTNENQNTEEAVG